METCFLTYQNYKKEEFTINFSTYPNIPTDVLSVWYEALIKYINTPGGRVQTSYTNFDLAKRSPEFLANKLEEAIKYINQSRLSTEYGFKIEREIIPPDYPTEVHNEIHHKFELLMGQVWNPSKWQDIVYSLKDNKLRQAIQALNDYSHELEQATTPNTPPHLHYIFEYPKELTYHKPNNLECVDLPKSVSDIFSIGSVAGGVYLNYTQLGKTLEEVLNEEDEEIDFENISAHCLTNGSFSLSFEGDDESAEKQKILREQHIKLAKQRGIVNLDNTALTLGRPLIGKINHSNFSELHNTLKEYDTLVGIEINGHKKTLDTYSDKF